MKLHHLLFVGLSLLSMGAQARDIHGVKGYYNYTAQQLQALGDPFTYFSDGTKLKAWYRDVQYDGDYMVLYPGITNTTRKTYTSKIWGTNKTISQQGFDWRVSFNLFHSTYPLTITKNYPVVGVKYSVPENVIDSVVADMFNEIWWINPYSGKEETMSNKTCPDAYRLSGVGGNARITPYAVFHKVAVNDSQYANYGDTDSLSFMGWNSKGNRKMDNGVVWNYCSQKKAVSTLPTDTSIVVMRLPSTSGEKANVIVFFNWYALRDSSAAYLNERVLDHQNLVLPRMHFNFYGAKDTLNADGSTISASDRPVAYLKWLKTFPSLSEAMASVTEENNWGDGTESAAKSQLNYALYYAEQALAGFKFRNSDPEADPDDEAYITYQAAYEEANSVYNSADATDADYTAAYTTLQAARVAFNEAVDLPDSLVYNYVKSATGNGGIVIAGDESTIGGTTGNALTIGANDAASPLSFVATGSVVNGQKTYTLKSGSAAVVQASDGTLLLVEGATGSTFTFSERDTEGHGFDIHCGDYYYYLDQNGVLSFTKEIPEEATTDFDALSPYLFTIEDALGDYANTASEEEKTGLKAGWEFNDTPVDDPGTKGVVDGVEKTMAEYGETKMIEGWRMSRWRAYSRVNQETVKNSDNTSATCLVLTSAATYDNWDGSQSGIVNDFSGPAALRMDHGTENPFYVRDPNPRDSLYAYNFNAGINRYFAIKMKGTSDVKFGTLTFLGANTVIISADQIAGQKGDVYYWDLLNSGFSVGKNLYTSAFFSPEGFTSADSKLYIDWMRTYSSIDEIPEESFAEDVANGITTVKSNSTTKNYVVNGRTVTFFEGGEVYAVDGSLVANVKGHNSVTLPQGLYIVKSGNAVAKIVLK